MIILAPEIPKPAPEPIRPVVVVDRLDRKLIEAVGQHDGQPVPLWSTIHSIADAEGPAGRTERRLRIGRVLCRARALLRRGILVRVDGANVRLREHGKPPVPALPAPPMPVKNVPPAPDPSVGDWASFYPGGPSRRVFKV
jgi:hypothetical protein